MPRLFGDSQRRWWSYAITAFVVLVPALVMFDTLPGRTLRHKIALAIADDVMPAPVVRTALPPEVEPASVPADFGNVEAIYLGCNELVQYHQAALVRIVKSLQGRVHVIGLVDDAQQAAAVRRLITEAGLSEDAIELVTMPLNGMWIRDYGPMFARMGDQSLVILDTQYVQRDRSMSDQAPAKIAARMRLPVVQVPLTLEGGNLLSNGQGLLVTTTALLHRNIDRGYDIPAIGRILRDYYGVKTWVYLDALVGEPTGHVDMFVTLLAPNLAVVGQLDPSEDPVNAHFLDTAAATLAKVNTPQGPMQVVRMPMPTHRDGIWRSYTNVVMANGVILVPSYPDVSPEMDRQVLDQYCRLLPDWKVVGVNASNLITRRGALHCVTVHVPATARPAVTRY